MRDGTYLRVHAIWALVILYAINALTMKLDSVLTATVFSLVAGLAGYELGIRKGGGGK